MPRSISEECEDYVEAYGDQVIELLAQEIDPAKVTTITYWSPFIPFLTTAERGVKNVM